MKELVITPASHWGNVYADRIIGSIRRECFDHILVLNGRYLRRTLKE